MTERVECAVIGAGVVGLAVARTLALSGREVVLLEAAGAIGTGVSSRSSEVIHAGIYYPSGSLKARLCVSGRPMLYAFCASRSVAHKRIGKLVVATEAAQIPTLEQYFAQACSNGVDDLGWLAAEQARRLEPQIRCTAALWSPSTGIVDSHGLMSAYQADFEAYGGIVALDSPVIGGSLEAREIELEIGGGTPFRLRAAVVVNCAGLQAQTVSQRLRGVPPQAIAPAYFAKGHYFALAGASPFRHLVYPVAVAGGLGTHVTLDLVGRARFGPDVQWISEPDYSFDISRLVQFAAAIRLYYPELDAARLQPGYTGIRPKITPAGQAAADFCIRGPAQHEGSPYVALYGIESPGLTASLALAEHVKALVEAGAPESAR